jgi:nucleoside-diphosphate-sugar epimerase
MDEAMRKVTIIGYGAIGREAAAHLTAQGAQIVIAQRNEPRDLPRGFGFRHCDLLDAELVEAACNGADVVILAAGLPYLAKVWRENWPSVMRHTIGACSRADARLVFVDNLYMYGPQSAPLTEGMPLTDHGVKPKVRADVTRLWMEAHASGRLRAAAVRGSDFYGPTSGALSRLGDVGLGRMVKGKSAMAIDPVDSPHDFTFTSDFGRTVATIAFAGDDAYGHAWHVPNAGPTPTLRILFDMAARMLGQERAKISRVPTPLLAPFVPFMRELGEMRFQWDRPYVVDTSKFAKRFWSTTTPFEEGIAATLRAYGAKI